MTPRPHPTDGPHLFIIPPDVWATASRDEVAATVAGLKEAGLYKLPYPRVTVRLAADSLLRWTAPFDPKTAVFVNDAALTGGKDVPVAEMVKRHRLVLDEETGTYISQWGKLVWCEARGLTEDVSGARLVTGSEGGVDNEMKCVWHRFETDITDQVNAVPALQAVTDLLVVLLATKNAIKTTRSNKLAKLGIGKYKGHKDFKYITTISLPPAEEMEDDAEHPAGTGSPKCPHLRRGHFRNVHYGPKRAFTRAAWIAPVFVNADKEWTKTRAAYNVSLPPLTDEATRLSNKYDITPTGDGVLIRERGQDGTRQDP